MNLAFQLPHYSRLIRKKFLLSVLTGSFDFLGRFTCPFRKPWTWAWLFSLPAWNLFLKIKSNTQDQYRHEGEHDLGNSIFFVPYLSPPLRPPLGIPIKIATHAVDDEKGEKRYHCFPSIVPRALCFSPFPVSLRHNEVYEEERGILWPRELLVTKTTATATRSAEK